MTIVCVDLYLKCAFLFPVYVEVAGSTDPTITLATLTGQTTQKWNIQVSQIHCDSQWKAPKDCTQWFTTNTGTIRSYNTR